MKKIILSNLVLIMLLSGGCMFTDRSDIIISDISGSGSFDPDQNISTMEIRFHIENTNLITGEITNWRFFLFPEEDETVAYLIFSKDNYRWNLCEDITCQNVELRETAIWVTLTVTKSGDIYQGQTPYLMDLDVEIEDENEHRYAISKMTDFDFTRYPAD